MASRLALKYGLVSEEDRLANSSDALVVTEPTTGSKARTKGSLYLIVCSRTIGGRTRDACRLVADTIQRDYYYDESAGIAIVLEKAIRSANKRLRSSRGSGPAVRQLAYDTVSAEADAVSGAECGATSPDRTNRRNGYRHRDFDTRAGRRVHPRMLVACPRRRAEGRTS